MNIIFKRFFIFKRATKLKRMYASILFYTLWFFVFVLLRISSNASFSSFPLRLIVPQVFMVFLLCMYEKRFLNGDEKGGMSSNIFEEIYDFFRM